MKDCLGDRMKHNYEDRYRTFLTRRTPVIIRLDGKAFHTLTRDCTKPYDYDFIDTMETAAIKTAGKIQGCQLGYVQSDEVSLLLTDFNDINTEAWFDYNVQKMASVAASYMTAHFNALSARQRWYDPNNPAVFDARCFNIPNHEVANYFLWRAQDWHRNSVQMLAQAYFSPKALHGKNQAAMHEMLHKVGVNWAAQSSRYKNGTFFSSCMPFYDVTNNYKDINLFVNTYAPSIVSA